MSIQAVTWAMKQKIKPAIAKLLLIAIANYADKNGKCWPSKSRLAADCCYDKANLCKVIAALKKAGLIDVQERFENGTQLTSIITILATTTSGAATTATSGARTTAPTTTSGARTITPSVNGTMKASGAGTTQTVIIEPSEEIHQRKQRADSCSQPPPTLTAPSKKESPQPQPTLTQRLAAADDCEASDEERFWAAVDVLAKAGLPRSQLAKLARLTEAYDECLGILCDVAGARQPPAYLHAIVRAREREKREAERLDDAAYSDARYPDDVPEFVREYLRYGWHVERLEGGEWKCGNAIFDAGGEEIGC